MIQITHMKWVLFSLLISSTAFASWSQPPVGCIEEFVPQPLSVPCPDLSQVSDPNVEIPSTWSTAEVQFWNVDHRTNLMVCRAAEIDRRHRLGLQNFSDSVLQVAWMRLSAAENQSEKILAIEEAAQRVGMPAQILFGAIKQESLLSNLGLTPDGNNYSCGMGQINIQEWCRSISALPEAEQMKLGWPVGISCDPAFLPTRLLAPFYAIGMSELGNRPDYLLQSEHFKSITLEQVVEQFPAGTAREQNLRFSAAQSFLRHCQNPKLGIFAKATELKHLFETYVPRPMRKANRYHWSERFVRDCSHTPSRYVPLHTGWLLAVAIYNAGPKQVSLLSHYFGLTPQSFNHARTWREMNPLDLIEGLHWGGKYSESDNLLHFRSLKGERLTQSWFKSCIVQRHIARVIQYVTLPGVELARSLESDGCSKNRIPENRKRSSGKK